MRLILKFLAINAIAVLTANGQRVYNYNLPGYSCYCEMIMEETALKPKGVIVLDVFSDDILAFFKENPYTQNGGFSDYNFLLVKIINLGSSKPTDCYQVIANAAAYSSNINQLAFYHIEETAQGLITIRQGSGIGSFSRVIYSGEFNLVRIKTALDETAVKVQYQLPDSQAEYASRLSNYRRNFDIGFSVMPSVLGGNKLGLDRSGLTVLGLTLSRSIFTNYSLKFSVFGSIKIPDPESLQSGIQSEIMAAVQRGSSRYYLDEVISGHILAGGEISLRYYQEKSKQFRPFIAVGLGGYSFINISAQIQEVIDISNLSGGGSSIQDLIGGNTADLQNESINDVSRLIAPSLEIGFDYRLTPISKISISAPTRYYFDLSDTRNTALNLGLNFSLMFTLNSRRAL